MPRFTGLGGRRRVPYLVIGVLLIVVCAAGTVLAVMQVGHREPVLVLNRPVSVGQVLTAQDVQQVAVSIDSGAGVIPAGQASTVLGQPVAYSLPAGTLLSQADLGKPEIPPPGQAEVAVAVKPGQFPPTLAAGATVSVIVASTNSGSGASVSAAGPWAATVTDVAAPGNDTSTVVSLLLPVAEARQVASLPSGQVSLMTVPSGGQ